MSLLSDKIFSICILKMFKINKNNKLSDKFSNLLKLSFLILRFL